MTPVHSSIARIAGLLALASCLSSSPAESTGTPPATYRWRETGPPARSDHSAIYDPVGDRMIVFGGLEGATAHNEVWALSLAGTPTWSKLTTEGIVPPGPRSGHSAIYDPIRQRMIVFGGADAGGNLLNECWALSLSGQPASWAPLSASNAPPSARRNHAAVYDPVGDRMLIFGGNDGADRNEVWALSLGGPLSPEWSLLTPSGTPPSARQAASAIYDPVRQRMLMFGGIAGSTRYNDTWSLALTGPLAWSQLSTSGTLAGRAYHGAVYDPVRDRMIVVGGAFSYSNNDVQALTLAGTPAWQMIGFFADGTHAPAIYDPIRDRVLLHGGLDGLNCYSFTDVWTLSSPGSFARIPAAPAMPWPVSDAAGIYDPSQNRFVVFGGQYYSTFEPGYNQGANGLTLGSMQWASLGEASPGRTGSSASFVSLGPPRMLIFGGDCTHLCSNAPFNEVWQLPLNPPGPMQQLAPSGTKPVGRSRHTSIYDPVRNSLIVFGGIGSTFLFPVPRYNDVWELNLNGTPSWIPWTPLGTPPSARGGHSAIYDGLNQRMIVFGGRDNNGLLGDVWSLSLAGTPTWTLLAPDGAGPSAREEHIGVYDTGNHRMLVYGGSTQTDLWSLELTGSPSWMSLGIVGGPKPDGHDGLASALDPQGVLWTFGGPANGLWRLMPNDETAVEPRPGHGDELFVAAVPNPAQRALVIGFALRDRSPARIDVFDLSGRKIEGRDVGSYGAGFHRVELPASSRLPTGTYLVRLTQGSRTFTTKAVLMH